MPSNWRLKPQAKTDIVVIAGKGMKLIKKSKACVMILMIWQYWVSFTKISKIKVIKGNRMTNSSAYFWNQDNLKQTTQGQWHHSDKAEIDARRIVTDTRQIKQAMFFLAIKGERFDAHDFIKMRISKVHLRRLLSVLLIAICHSFGGRY